MNKLIIGAVVVVIIAIAGYWLFPHNQQTVVGGTTNYDTISVSGLQLGSGCNNGFGTCLGTLQSANNFGTTTLIGSGGTYFTVTASTTKEFDFACTNVTPADQVVAWFAPTTTPPSTVTRGMGWYITEAHASSTSGFCTVAVTNGSGADAIIPQQIASTTGYRAIH